MASKQEMMEMAARLRATVSESKRQMLDTAARMLEEAAEETPTRHGHWIVKVNPNWKAYTIHECSECGYYIHDTKLTIRDTLNYCQNCGAHMDEEVKLDAAIH